VVFRSGVLPEPLPGPSCHSSWPAESAERDAVNQQQQKEQQQSAAQQQENALIPPHTITGSSPRPRVAPGEHHAPQRLRGGGGAGAKPGGFTCGRLWAGPGPRPGKPSSRCATASPQPPEHCRECPLFTTKHFPLTCSRASRRSPTESWTDLSSCPGRRPSAAEQAAATSYNRFPHCSRQQPQATMGNRLKLQSISTIVGCTTDRGVYDVTCPSSAAIPAAVQLTWEGSMASWMSLEVLESSRNSRSSQPSKRWQPPDETMDCLTGPLGRSWRCRSRRPSGRPPPVLARMLQLHRAPCWGRGRSGCLRHPGLPYERVLTCAPSLCGATVTLLLLLRVCVPPPV